MKEYKFKQQYAEFNKKAVSAQTIGEELIRLENENRLTPDLIISKAKNEEHPLHNCFNWDDTDAAIKYRLVQAKSMIRLIVEVTPYDEEIRVLTSIVVDGKPEYVETTALLKTEDGRELVLNRMMRDIEILKRRYAAYAYLADYCEQLNNIRSGMKIVDKVSTEVRIQC